MKGWKYYNRAMIPTTAPNEPVDTSCIEDKSIWKENKRAILARWTSDFDCGYETEWWYIVKDAPFDLSVLKSKRRYEIKKGCKNFEVKVIKPSDYREALYEVQFAAFSAYPRKYRPVLDKERFSNGLARWNRYVTLGAFDKDNILRGYALLEKTSDLWFEFIVLRTTPACEKLGINAALVEKVLDYCKDFLQSGGILCDGSRSINHETNFQDYLEKYFGFRRAFCRLHIAYNPKYAWLVKALYPWRRSLSYLNGLGVIHQISALLKMEEISRRQKKEAC